MNKVRSICLRGGPGVNDDSEWFQAMLKKLCLPCFDRGGEWLDMIEARQRHVYTIVAQVSNWKQMITVIRFVEFGDVENSRAYEERVAALRALGIIVVLLPRLSLWWLILSRIPYGRAGILRAL